MESTNRLKQRLSRLFRPPTLLRTSCGSTTSAAGSIFTSSSAADTSSRRSLSAATTESISPSTAFDRSLSISSSSRFLSLDCASACRPTKASDPIDVVPYVVTFNVADKKDERELTQPGDLQATEEKEEARKNNRRTNKNKKKVKPLLSNNAYGFTSSSDSEFFSDDDGGHNEKGADAFFSSRSFSSDSSAFYSRPSKRKACKKKNKKQRKPPPPRKRTSNNKKGVPVMKRSSDPYIDFRSSMVEMIVERQIFGARDLERLLYSYLTLNSPHHHAVILRAFADISQVLYGH